MSGFSGDDAFDRERHSAVDTYWLNQPSSDTPIDDAPLWTPLDPEPGRGLTLPDGRVVSPQRAAYESLADELFYGGSAGGGKTDLELGLAITAHKNAVIFRTEFTQFRGPEGIIERSKAIIGDRGTLNENTYQWRGLPGGRSIEFAGVGSQKALGKWKGRAHDLKAYDEITEFAEAWYRFLNGWLRTTIPGQRTRSIATGNPPTTTGGRWVIAYWAPWLDKMHPNPAQPGELRWFASIAGKDVELLSGDRIWINGTNEACAHDEGLTRGRCRRCLAEPIAPRSRTFIPASVEDNPHYMRTGYAQVLDNLPEPLRSQLRHGDFEATQDDDAFQVIKTAHVQAAQRRWRAQPERPEGLELTNVGNDPSRGGADKFCIAKRYGWWVAPIIKHDGKDAPDGAAGVGLLLNAIGDEQPQSVNIDIGGSAGSSVFDHAREAGLPAIALNGSEKSIARDKTGTLRFFNKRAEFYWLMREALEPSSEQDIALPDDPELLADLCATRWSIGPRGIRCEDKKDVKQRLGRSPDVGEAVIYAFAESTSDGLGFLQWANERVADAKRPTPAPAPASTEPEAPPAPAEATTVAAEPRNPWLDALPTRR